MKIYIFYEDDTGKGILKKLETRREALDFVTKEKLDPSRTEIFEVARSLRVCLVLMDTPKEETAPAETKKPRKYTRKPKEEKKSEPARTIRLCDKCKTKEIAYWNKSGLCRECGARAINKRNHEKKKQEKKEKGNKPATSKERYCSECKTKRIPVSSISGLCARCKIDKHNKKIDNGEVQKIRSKEHPG